MVFSNLFHRKGEGNESSNKKQRKNAEGKRQGNDPDSGRKRPFGHHTQDSRKDPIFNLKKSQESKAEPDNNGGGVHSKKTRAQGPSDEALRLSGALKELSRQKKLDEALAIYRNPSIQRILDGHHACIIIDCCARCGRVDEAEKLVNELVSSGKHVNVETKTALIKGFAHSGQISKAEALFTSMCGAQKKTDWPNVRTVNTLLRGCLWSAATVDNEDCLTGGVVTAENVWKRCLEMQVKSPKSMFFDVSSFEYSISLLCQALRTEDASNRIQDMRKFFSLSDSATTGIPQSVSETLALSYLALMRAFAVLGDVIQVKNASKSFGVYSKATKTSLCTDTDEPNQVPSSKRARYANKHGKETNGGRRGESNTLYRTHRINEAEKDAQIITDLCESGGLVKSPRQLARRMTTRLLFLSGGGSTDAGTKEGVHLVSANGERFAQHKFLNTLYCSYGLDNVLKTLGVAMKSDTKFLKKKDCNRILGAIGLQGGIVLDNGTLDIERIFRIGMGDGKTNGTKKQSKKQVEFEIELGAGFGDWIVKKARDNPSSRFLSVELRSDRVWQTFVRTVLLSGTAPVDNLCVVGAESCSFLSSQIQEGTVSAIYVNHPEPPTQTFGADTWNLQSIADGGPEPAHMLSSDMMEAAAKCLSKKTTSRLVIVTDNKWYGCLICATLIKMMGEKPGLLFPSVLDKSKYNTIQSFSSNKADAVTLYEGKPGSDIGHPEASLSMTDNEGQTYFDRLWRTGAGSHSEKTSRFIICATTHCSA